MDGWKSEGRLKEVNVFQKVESQRGNTSLRSRGGRNGRSRLEFIFGAIAALAMLFLIISIVIGGAFGGEGGKTVLAKSDRLPLAVPCSVPVP